MRILKWNQAGFRRSVAAAAAASSLSDPAIEKRVRAVVQAVRDRGDAALRELTERFDRVDLPRGNDWLRVTGPTPRVPAELRRAIGESMKNIVAFSRESLRRGLPRGKSRWDMRNAQGSRVGEKFDPLRRVGIYVPGGTAPLVSTALMTVALAKVAGCPEIVVCTPPGKRRSAGKKPVLIDRALFYAARTAGATEIYQVGGAQAIAAMAFGTRTIKRVQKVFGPGNAYVTAAKRLLFGQVAVDLLSGPSEVLVVADDSAHPRFIAADMMAQAEHGSGYERVWLVTTSPRVLAETQREIRRQLPARQRRRWIEPAMTRGGVGVLVKNLAQAVEIANLFAPEHCQVMTKNPAPIVKKITTAGAIFIGPWSPTVVGDYLAGPSHELPTGGAASFSGLTVDQFQRRTSVLELSREALRKSLGPVTALAVAEGLDAHVASARIRFTKVKRGGKTGKK